MPGPETLLRLHRQRAVAHFLSEEIHQLVDTVNFRLSMLLEVWSKHRAREPFLKTLETRFHNLPTSELLLLEPGTLSLINRFYRHLGDLVIYLEYTEDMVLTLEDQFKSHFQKMTEVLVSLGPALHAEIDRSEAAIQQAEHSAAT